MHYYKLDKNLLALIPFTDKYKNTAGRTDESNLEVIINDCARNKNLFGEKPNSYEEKLIHACQEYDNFEKSSSNSGDELKSSRNVNETDISKILKNRREEKRKQCMDSAKALFQYSGYITPMHATTNHAYNHLPDYSQSLAQHLFVLFFSPKWTPNPPKEDITKNFTNEDGTLKVIEKYSNKIELISNENNDIKIIEGSWEFKYGYTTDHGWQIESIECTSKDILNFISLKIILADPNHEVNSAKLNLNTFLTSTYSNDIKNIFYTDILCDINKLESSDAREELYGIILKHANDLEDADAQKELYELIFSHTNTLEDFDERQKLYDIIFKYADMQENYNDRLQIHHLIYKEQYKIYTEVNSKDNNSNGSNIQSDKNEIRSKIADFVKDEIPEEPPETLLPCKKYINCLIFCAEVISETQKDKIDTVALKKITNYFDNACLVPRSLTKQVYDFCCNHDLQKKADNMMNTLYSMTFTRTMFFRSVTSAINDTCPKLKTLKEGP